MPAFILAACERKIRRGDNTEAVAQFEARVAARLTNLAKQVQGLHTFAQAQVALINGRGPEIHHYVCCGAPRRCAPSSARSRQAAL
jgi:hypothetical protein